MSERAAPGEKDQRGFGARAIGGIGLVVTLAALVGIPLVLVTHRDFAKVESGSAVPIPSTTAQVRLALAPVSGDGRGDVRMTGLGFGSNAAVVITATAAASSATAGVGEITANDRGAFILDGRLPASVVAACAVQGSCVFEGTPGIVLVTAATRDGTTKTTAAYQVKS